MTAQAFQNRLLSPFSTTLFAIALMVGLIFWHGSTPLLLAIVLIGIGTVMALATRARWIAFPSTRYLWLGILLMVASFSYLLYRAELKNITDESQNS